MQYMLMQYSRERRVFLEEHNLHMGLCRGVCIYITVSNLHVGWFVRGDGTTSWGQDTVSLNMVLRYIRALPLLLYIPPVRVLAVTPSLPPSPTRL